jgi:hypothetical protein
MFKAIINFIKGILARTKLTDCITATAEQEVNVLVDAASKELDKANQAIEKK